MKSCREQDLQDTLEGLKILNSTPKSDYCPGPHWSGDGSCCINYVGCGEPCARPCELCLVWTGYGAVTAENSKKTEA